MPQERTDLYFMRHAIPEMGLGKRDRDRELTKEGIQQAKEKARAFLEADFPLPMTIVSSPSKRAMQTTEIMADIFGVRDIKIVEFEEIIEWGFLRSYIKNEPILFIGHQPFFGQFIYYLTRHHTKVSQGSIHRIDYDLIEDRGEYISFL